MPTLELVSERLVLRPVVASDAGRLHGLRASPEIARWWGGPDQEPGWPLADSDVESFTIWRDHEIVGFIQCYEVLDSLVRYAGIDVFLTGLLHGRGFGREAIQCVIRYLVDVRGHHRIVIDPAADNAAAIACYHSCGFRVVGLMHNYERDSVGDGWHDGLLMECVIPQ